MTRVPVKFDDLVSAFEFVSADQLAELEAYLCVETGVIHYHSEFGDDEEEPLPEDIEDSEKYVPVPSKNDLDLGKRLALRFADEFLPDASDAVRETFRRPGAYGRFKSLLERRGILQQWFEYEEEARNKALREWCEVNEIEILG